ncbi:hypothetical protein PRIPAC_96648 [Pristionchus pacificus]|uniref:Uncharacterized protein n=1 Tax=Pristionchus pacificus TaxID=54126 RepID=A0A2A6BC48_PRIPA|nr:hypothetical protein PRIPAC_96648 [Pristionchus pacificus]|eukprot:PDM63455.1 hypothetical protein PRIPAC_53812 [Pristionchus pacificus]
MQCADGVCYCYRNDRFHQRFLPSTLLPFDFKECGQLFLLDSYHIEQSVSNNCNQFPSSIDGPLSQSWSDLSSFCSHSEKGASGPGMAQTSHYYYSSTSKMDVNEESIPNISHIPNTPHLQFNFSMEAKLWALRFGLMTVFTDPNLVMRHVTDHQGVDQNATDQSNSLRDLIYSITRLPN